MKLTDASESLVNAVKEIMEKKMSKDAIASLAGDKEKVEPEDFEAMGRGEHKKPKHKKKHVKEDIMNEGFMKSHIETPAHRISTDKSGHVELTHKDSGKSVYLQGDDATHFHKELNRMKTNKVSLDMVDHHLSQYHHVMEANENDDGWYAHKEMHGSKAVSAADWKKGWRLNKDGKRVQLNKEEAGQVDEAELHHIKVGEKVRLTNPKAPPRHTVDKIDGQKVHITKDSGEKVVLPLNRIKGVKAKAAKLKEEAETLDERNKENKFKKDLHIAQKGKEVADKDGTTKMVSDLENAFDSDADKKRENKKSLLKTFKRTGRAMTKEETVSEESWHEDKISDLIKKARAQHPDKKHEIHTHIAHLIDAVGDGREVRGHIKTIQGMMKEEVEQVDEVLDTAKKKNEYLKAAEKSGKEAQSGVLRTMNDPSKKAEFIKSAIKMRNRGDGIERVMKKVQKEEVELVDEAKNDSTWGVDSPSKKTGQHVSADGRHIAKVHKKEGEYVVSIHSDGKHNKAADYHTDDKEDAHGTAMAMLSHAVKHAKPLGEEVDQIEEGKKEYQVYKMDKDNTVVSGGSSTASRRQAMKLANAGGKGKPSGAVVVTKTDGKVKKVRPSHSKLVKEEASLVSKIINKYSK